jgi:Alpha/beta hydrolase family
VKKSRTASRNFIVRTAILLALVTAASACGGSDDTSASSNAQEPQSESEDNAANPQALDEVIDIGGGRGLYVRCTGTGSPTVVMEGGDGDTSDSYAFAESTVADVTRTCVYDRANLGRSDPDPGPRGLEDLVGDLKKLLEAAEIPGPYVLVGTSGGGYITAGYAVANPREVAGMVFIDVPAPFRNPPPPIVEETTWDHPTNVEERDYLQVEKDAWAARKRIGDIPITVVSVKYTAADIRSATFPSERAGMSRNIEDQRGWLVLSPRAEQIVVDTGHAVEEEDPELVIDVILDVVREAR